MTWLFLGVSGEAGGVDGQWWSGWSEKPVERGAVKRGASQRER
ncbi:hypothetical protein [Herbiconiux daphne]|uniref:Uncharacterized protein n=1 Tax=Herbiconiux daphne TaxID=2970914 RepID=A0ABT2H196_9MICO|nr:hypothetical protein [Herbiconiux daphne]MCS5733690.1 hypothetical protein [Herbiconiux daphne]